MINNNCKKRFLQSAELCLLEKFLLNRFHEINEQDC